MKALEIISQLRKAGVSIRLENENLKLVGKTKELSSQMLLLLKENKQQLISFLKDNQQQEVAPIIAIEERKSYPLSNAQKRIWVLSQFEGGNSAYNIGSALYLKGVVQSSVLKKAFSYCIQRHESLRTVFKEENGEPVQVVLDSLPLESKELNITSETDQKSILVNEIKKMNNHHFNLEKGPLVYIKLIKFSLDEYALLFSMHHIISDGWSAGILLQEVMTQYEKLCKEEALNIPPLEIHYKDFSAWLSDKLEGEFGKQAVEFWKRKNLSDLSPIELPCDFPRPDVNRFEGALNKFYFEPSFYKEIEKFAIAQKTTVFNVFRSAVSLLLHKSSGQKNICVGTPVSGRSHHQLSNQIGLYVNTVPLVSTIESSIPFNDYLKTITEDSLELFKYQDYPLDLIIESQDIERNASRNPLFDVLMVVQNTAIGDGSIEVREQHGFTMESMDKYFHGEEYTEKNDVPAKFDLTFNFAVEPNGRYYAEIEYSTQLFKRSTIQRLYAGFKNVLKQVIANSTITIGEIGLINDEEKDILLGQFNKPIDFSSIVDPMQYINAGMAKGKGKDAIVFNGNTFSYSQLDEYSNGFASLFNNESVEKVGLFCKRSEKMVFAVLGAIKSGVCYVPIDTKYPEERINFIIQDSNLSLIITDEESRSLIPSTYQGKVELIENVSSEVRNTSSQYNENSTAYVIYTSGSTGKPKGVEISRSNLASFIGWSLEEFKNTSYQLMYAATSYCFDLSIFEMLLPISQGKKIRILSSAIDIQNYSSTDRNILINTVPSVVRNLLDNEMDWSNVIALNMAGEPVPKMFRNQLDYANMEVRNLYGPSEDTTYSTCYKFENDGYDEIPIGTPISNTQAYVLDENLKLLPIGVEGELYLSGLGVAKGYINREKLSTERFVNNPFVDGERMYRTGDVVKWSEDGKLFFIGRNDDQVKLRGFRIELGEIQYQLELLDTISQAVVVIDEIGGDKVLVAYYQSNEEQDDELLKQQLSERIPSYMIPEVLIYLNEIPLNSNGKVDKKRLPKANRQIKTELVEPQTSTQESLLNMWKKVLGEMEFGITHSFFELGGHSLKATKLRSLVLNEMEKELTLNEIFLNPTIIAQAEIIDSKGKTRESVVQQITDVPKGEYPLSYAQERLWVLTQFEEASKAYHMPAAFTVKGNLKEIELEKALNMVVKKHEILRTRFYEGSNGPVQSIIPAELASIPLDVVQVESQSEVIEELTKDWAKPFELGSGQLFRCTLYKLSEQAILSFNMHHIISDGWSIGVLFSDVVKAYSMILSGGVEELLPLDIQYKDFAIWQKAELNDKVLDQHLNYWKNEVFENGDIPLELPYDRPRPEVKTYNGDSFIYQFSKNLTTSINKQSRENGVSTYMSLLAQVNILLKKLSNQNHVTVGIPVSGRDSVQLQQQVGFYVNTLPLRTYVEGELDYVSFLKNQREILLSAFDHQHFPFEMLVEGLQHKRNMSRSPLFDVMVVMQDFDVLDSPQLNLADDIHFEKFNHSSNHTKYDLTFSFSEINGHLNLELEYNSDLFDQSTIKTFVERLEKIAIEVVKNPTTVIKDLNVLGEQEFEVLTSKLDQTHIEFERKENIISRFKEIVSQFPDKVAVRFDGKDLTYSDLDVKSGQLAKYLRDHCEIKKESLVVLHLERSDNMIVSILAVLKAGGAYVPVDPSYPSKRIQYIINDSSPSLVISDSQLEKERAKLLDKSPILELDQFEFEGEVFSSEIDPKQLAYIIYTSGTTGNPKGVQIEHEQVNRLFFTNKEVFDFNESDVWTMFHSYCFDFSVWEMYGALLKGGTLIIVPKNIAQDSVAFFKLLESEKVTVLNQTPTAFRTLSSANSTELEQSDLKVRYVIFGGEKLSPVSLSDWNNHFPECKLVNMYGITETTVHVTFKEITSKEIKENTSNIGIPIPTLSCYVLDNDLNICPIGVVGELCVGGAGVARGYLNQPELTEEKFIDHPLIKNGKLYRSGDFGRVLGNGDLEYIGRRDDQVKIRGHRIEIHEVEVGVMTLSSIKEVVVQVIQNGEGEYELIAYIITTDTGIDYREQLSGVLPNYMIPDHFIELDEFPLTSNGKLDKNALPDINSVDTRRGEYVAPRNDIDEKIISIWEEILQKEKIGIQDNFFDMGGHSLKATRVVVAIQAEFGVKVDLKNLFVDPTVENLSNYVETLQWMENESSADAESTEEELIL